MEAAGFWLRRRRAGISGGGSGGSGGFRGGLMQRVERLGYCDSGPAPTLRVRACVTHHARGTIDHAQGPAGSIGAKHAFAPLSPHTVASALFSAFWLPGFLPFEHTFSTDPWAARPCARVSVLGGGVACMHQLRRDSCDQSGRPMPRGAGWARQLSRALRAPDCWAPPSCPPGSWAGAMPGIWPCACAGSVAAGSLIGSVAPLGGPAPPGWAQAAVSSHIPRSPMAALAPACPAGASSRGPLAHA